MAQSLTVSIELIRNGITPTYATTGSAGADLYAAIDETIILPSQSHALIPCGFIIAVPVGFEAQVRSRSGLALKHAVMVLNSPGTIDSDYRGEVKVVLANFGKDTFEIIPGMRIAQMVIAPYLTASWKEEIIQPDTNNQRTGGFGSTGIK